MKPYLNKAENKAKEPKHSLMTVTRIFSLPHPKYSTKEIFQFKGKKIRELDRWLNG